MILTHTSISGCPVIYMYVGVYACMFGVCVHGYIWASGRDLVLYVCEQKSALKNVGVLVKRMWGGSVISVLVCMWLGLFPRTESKLFGFKSA